jgi:hypothetical protein
MTPAQFEGLEKELLAEAERRKWAAYNRTLRDRGSIPRIIYDMGDDAERDRQLAELGNPDFCIARVIVFPPEGGVLPGMRPWDAIDGFELEAQEQPPADGEGVPYSP